ncbi:MAG: NUDIX hydrolase [Anaerolineae bacterium]|nr:NUDIX hydrolase [Anaerolineae bacterium]
MCNTRYPDAPRVAVGAVIIHQKKVLLVLRGKPPAQGKWAIPGGSVKLGETLQAAAERETFEETGLRVKAGEVLYTFDAIVRDEQRRVQFHYVILDLRAEALEPAQSLTPGDDALNVGWFSLAEVDQLDTPVSDTTYALLRQILVDEINDRS